VSHSEFLVFLTLPKAEFPALVKLHVYRQAKPDSNVESYTSPALSFWDNKFAQAILQGITMAVKGKGTP
jgi:hypothetical protein